MSCSILAERTVIISSHSHVLNSDVFEDLTVVNVPHGLIVPDFRGQQDGSQNNPLPVTWANVQLGICQQPLQIYLQQRQWRSTLSENAFYQGSSQESIHISVCGLEIKYNLDLCQFLNTVQKISVI